MKFYISYFYQVRNFKPYVIGFSTAVSDPVWYTHDKGIGWKDKNGVYNGLRADPLIPSNELPHMCGSGCAETAPECSYLKAYLEQLRSLDFNEFISQAERIASKVKDLEALDRIPIICLLVHEAPQNPCSERWALKKWFAENGYDLEEFSVEKL